MINSVFWVAAIIVFLGIEAATSYLVSIWFAGGAIASLLVSLFTDNLGLQILVFLLISLLCVAFVRKAAIKNFKLTPGKTNLDRIVGSSVVIKETVDNIKNQGAVTINDVEWKAKSENDEVILTGELAEVVAIEGVKLVVKKKEDK